MRMNKFALLIGLAVAVVLFFEVTAHADESDQSTKMTFSEPIQVPGRVLPAGTYLFKLVSLDDPNVVEILDADGTRVDAVLQTISTQRPQPTSDVAINVAQPEGNIHLLLNWYYPGSLEGHEFVYSKREQEEIAADHQQIILTHNTAESGD